MAELLIVRRKYQWPEIQLNVWLLVMLVSACTVIGVYGSFITIQTQLALGIPWYMSYWVAAGSLTIVYLVLIVWLISQRRLLPSIVILGSFILFVVWLTGLVKISTELWGPVGSVNDFCVTYVSNQPPSGQVLNTLAWLEQNSICQSWKAGFSFALVGTTFLLWMMIMAWRVYNDDFDEE